MKMFEHILNEGIRKMLEEKKNCLQNVVIDDDIFQRMFIRFKNVS